MNLSYGRKLRRSIARCKFADEVTDLLARKIRKNPKYSDCKVESYGPMGLGAECHVIVKRGDEYIGSLTVKSDVSDNFVYVDYNAKRNSIYPKGSLGDINGFNNVTRPLPTDIDEALKLVFYEGGC